MSPSQYNRPPFSSWFANDVAQLPLDPESNKVCSKLALFRLVAPAVGFCLKEQREQEGQGRVGQMSATP